MSGTLFIVATPIGNLEDITLRSLKILKEVDLVLCEDTRVTRKLLEHYDIQVDTLSYHQQSGLNKKEEILNLLIQGKNLALVTDAGTPGISDPGNELIDFLVSQFPEVKIVSLPGASSVLSALSISGFDTSNFLFIGFWPKKKAAKSLKFIAECSVPVVFFDSPYRIIKNLKAIEENLGNKEIFIGQELTKLHERTLRGTISDVLKMLEAEEKELGRVKGELVCVLGS